MTKIALVVGHRKDNQGAVGNDGESEWEYNNKLAKKLHKKFPNNTKIFYRKTGPGGYSEKMKELHKRIDAWGADYSISMHFNAAGNPAVDGHEVLYCSKAGKKVAEILNNNFNKYLDNKDRGIKKCTKSERGGGFLCRGKSVCVLGEPFFAAHKTKYGKEVYKAYRDTVKCLIK